MTGQCRICGCTESNACSVPVGEHMVTRCAWADDTQTLCTACALAPGQFRIRVPMDIAADDPATLRVQLVFGTEDAGVRVLTLEPEAAIQTGRALVQAAVLLAERYLRENQPLIVVPQ